MLESTDKLRHILSRLKFDHKLWVLGLDSLSALLDVPVDEWTEKHDEQLEQLWQSVCNREEIERWWLS